MPLSRAPLALDLLRSLNQAQIFQVHFFHPSTAQGIIKYKYSKEATFG